MSERFFVAMPITGDRALLTESEAHHLIHVMRAAPGAAVTLFDGTGCEFLAEVRRIGRSEVELVVLERLALDRELAVPVVLGVALPKGDRQKWLVEKAVELGVSRIVPLRTSRGVAQPVQQALERLRRSVIEASKQCGRNRLLAMAEPESWQEFMTEKLDAQCRVVAHPAQRHEGRVETSFPELSAGSRGAVALAIGPEGGLTSEEVDLAVASGWRLVDLGARILRTETAAIVLAAWAGREILG